MIKDKTNEIAKKVHREPLTSDIIFKAVFGRENTESKNALIQLLNVVLDRKNDPIVDLEYKNPFSIADVENEKYIVMDILVTTSKNERIDIEMQVGHLAYFQNRTIFYVCDMITKGLEKGDNYDKMSKGIVISFIEGILFPDESQFHSVYAICNKETGKVLSDLLEIHYIELSKIRWENKSVEELTPLEQVGVYMMLTSNENHTDLLETLVKQGEGVISMTDGVLKKVSEEERLQMLRRARELWIRDEATARAAALMDVKLEIARNLKNDGIPIAVIAKNTGLTEEEIKQL